MAEGVGRYFFGDAGDFALTLDYQEYHLAGHLSAAAVEKENVLVFFRVRGEGPACLGKIQLHGADGRLSYGHQPLLVALAYDSDEGILREQVGNAQ